jgi:hypothetical protein
VRLLPAETRGDVGTRRLQVPEAVGDAEQFEGPALDRGGRGDLGEGGQAAGGLDVVGGDGGQVGEQGGEAVHRLAAGGDFRGGLGQG